MVNINNQYVGLSRRIMAFALDFIFIGGYILLLLCIGFGINTASDGISLFESPVAMNVLAFCVLVLPVIIYFSIQESSSYQATWGKRKVKIKVVNTHGVRISLFQAIIRSAIKFLPWQIAHTSVIYLWFGYQSQILLLIALFAQGLVVIYFICIWLEKKHRAIYDLIAGTFVANNS